MDLLRFCVDCLVTAWFVMSNMWAFGERSSGSTCVALCRLAVVAFIVGAIRWVVPMIICSTLYCCIPPLIRTLCAHNDMDEDDFYDLDYMHNKGNSRGGASEATIHALPFHTVHRHLQSSRSSVSAASNSCKLELSGCCICLSKYKEGVLVRELPCTHTFHMPCVDKWLRLSATCPLCKLDITRHSVDEFLL